MRLRLRAAGLAALSLAATPALAQEGPEDHGYDRGYDREGYQAPAYGGYDRDAREAWLVDCRQRLSSRDLGIGGAVIGGAVGGLAGNRIAGRGNRTVGTVAGAAVGAVAGAAIDKAEDRGRNRDECEAYLDDYYARYTHGGGYPGGPAYGYYPAYGYGYGYGAQGCCMQPAMMVPAPQAQPHCTETVEYVYEDVPVRPARRVIPRRSKVVPDKRVKIVPTR
ncbi:glycine zipper 2TM domain-containing protein [Novosphingobium sp. BL-52-GroH]|uniref:glycine zipper 2TM domain-containing protein n=1 Tax=Novosphingobium sp. BL-52-GroH TaxID=3349877 RepID=UPI003850DFD9